MTVDRDLLQQQRDQALHDLLDLERQVEDGEIGAAAAVGMRRRYQAAAAAAMAALADSPEVANEPDAHLLVARPTRRRRYALTAAYALAAVTATFAAAVLLPRFTNDRPPGGVVSGNEVTAAAGQTMPGRDPSTLSDAELEAVVAANPGVVGMRLALADRYVAEGAYDRAVRHYTQALTLQPGNPEAPAHFGWLLLQIGQPQPAIQFVNRALAIDPTLLDALWFKANIQLLGLADPGAALATLDQMRQRPDLTPQVRGQVDELTATARQRQSRAVR
jgi:tetratricopeptide (TPR) repeat protein